jgi:hypothetical protein
MFLPFIGFHSYQGNNATGLDAGLRLGGLMGFRIGEFVSLNGELSVDVLNPNFVQAGSNYSEYDTMLAFSPLVHVPLGNVELAFGPKFGVWVGSYSESGAQFYQTGSGSSVGGDLGAQGGVFFAVGPRLWLGGLTSFDVRSYTQQCFESACSSSNLPPSDKVLALSFALMM